ncbi:tellurite resistance TerB family protein [Trichormus azollae]|jgi:hypothetical protein|uniref:Co-chaperone DjlA N-terminal domain-containing protein n=1 Tax=Nostoc azollae (strain 0708) TaxID=551115 RepID=D7DVZ0_NOSA0|nr:tellurite resistance TerB family protein [Trichormus azollae]ADI65561.1 conserved hypothetical protein ['Nostoc azollae' 0708]
MSKCDLLKSRSSKVKLEPEVAIAIMGLFSASADGEGIIPTEEYPLAEMLEGIGVFEEYAEEDFDQLTAKVNTLREKEKAENLIPSAIASLTKKNYRETAYITAILVVGMEEDISESDQDYLFELQEVLKISDERAEELIDEVFEEYEEEEEE